MMKEEEIPRSFHENRKSQEQRIIEASGVVFADKPKVILSPWASDDFESTVSMEGVAEIDTDTGVQKIPSSVHIFYETDKAMQIEHYLFFFGSNDDHVELTVEFRFSGKDRIGAYTSIVRDCPSGTYVYPKMFGLAVYKKLPLFFQIQTDLFGVPVYHHIERDQYSTLSEKQWKNKFQEFILENGYNEIVEGVNWGKLYVPSA